jgi:hypothetical protein
MVVMKVAFVTKKGMFYSDICAVCCLNGTSALGNN